MVKGSPTIRNACLPNRYSIGWHFKYKGEEFGDYKIEDIFDENISAKKQIELMESMVEVMKGLYKGG